MDTTGIQEHIDNSKPGVNGADIGALAWADPLYLAHVENSALTTATLTLSPTAGNYSIALGSNSRPPTRPAKATARYWPPCLNPPGPGLAGLALAGLALRRRRV